MLGEKKLVKVLSHWRRRRRDWSVAATRATRETKNWLALSPRRLLGDVSRGDNQFARKSRRRRRDVSETSPQLRGRLRQLRPYLIGLETRWRLEETSRVSGESWEIQTCSIFCCCWDLFQSPAGLRDVSETCWRRRRNVSSVSLVSSRSQRHREDVSDTCWRLENVSKKIEHVSISRDSQETSQRRLRNQRRLESPTSHHLISRPVR